MGLIDKIKFAASGDVVEKLLQEGNKFNSASEKTKRHWKTTATKRLKELASQQEKKVVVQKTEGKKVKA